MCDVKKYLKDETRWLMVGFEHPKASDFSLSVWQTNRSATPLLIVRTLLFLTSLGIVLASSIIYMISGIYQFWFIYLTHWGLSLLTLSTGFSVLVSARCYFYGPISAGFNLPWYVKTYWVLYNAAVPVAFLVTLFYWTILFEAGVEEELNHGLDVAVHGLNSVVMLLLLLTSSHPSRLLHIYQPISFALAYVLFGVIYYLAGGVDPAGNPWVYSVINWQNPGTTIGLVALTGLLLVLLHLLTVGLALARDAISSRWVKPTVLIHNEQVPLRQPHQVV